MRVLHIDTGLEWRGGQRQALTLHKGLLSHSIESLFLGNQAGELYQLCENNHEEKYAGFTFNGELSSATHNEIQRWLKNLNLLLSIAMTVIQLSWVVVFINLALFSIQEEFHILLSFCRDILNIKI